MNILALNGSVKGKSGNTYMMLERIGQGIQKGKGSIEIVNLCEEKINPCLGCCLCWNEQAGVCVLQDEMVDLLKRVLSTDLLILASPIYYHNVTVPMKIFLERLMPFSNARIVQGKDGIYRHKCEVVFPPIVMVSSCGLADYCNFDLISLYGKMIAEHLDSRVLEEIYRTEANVFKAELPNIQIVIKAYLKVLERAGYELATNQCLSARTRRDIRRMMVDRDEYVKTANSIADEKGLYF